MGPSRPPFDRRIFLLCASLLSLLLSVQSQAQQPNDRRLPIDKFLAPFGIPPVLNGPTALSDYPTIDCTRLRNSVAQILCADREGAAADWSLNATIWALTHQLGETGRTAFDNEQTAWRATLAGSCSLPTLFGPGPIPRASAQCIHRVFRQRTDQLRSRLSGDALAEARLAPEHRAAFQQKLINEGYLQGTADGEFGPVTRDAIKRFQIANRLEPSGFMPARIDGPNLPVIEGSSIPEERRWPPQIQSAPANPAQVNAPPAWVVRRQLDAERERQRQEQAQQLERERPKETERKLTELRRQIDPERQSPPIPPAGPVDRRDTARATAPAPAQTDALPADQRVRVTTGPIAAPEPPVVSRPVPTAAQPSRVNQASFENSILFPLLLMLGVGAVIGMLIWHSGNRNRDRGATPEPDLPKDRAFIRPSGKKLKLIQATVVAFDDAGEAISNFGDALEARLDEDTISLYSPEAGRVLFHSLANDVRALEIVDSKEKLDIAKTAGRLALTGIAWSMVRPRRNGNVGLGSALLDYRYFGTEKYAVAHIQITFRDFTRIVLECDEAQLSAIEKLIPHERGSAKAAKDTAKAIGLIKRMISEGPKHLGELRSRVSDLETAIAKKSKIAHDGATFEERDAARHEVEVLRDKIAAPRAALYVLTTGLKTT